eukprot:gene3054-3820_t
MCPEANVIFLPTPYLMIHKFTCLYNDLIEKDGSYLTHYQEWRFTMIFTDHYPVVCWWSQPARLLPLGAPLRKSTLDNTYIGAFVPLGFTPPTSLNFICLLFINFTACAKKNDMLTNKKDTEFYFVRHGETDWGKEDILKGPQDLALNQSGKEQARQAGETLKRLLSNVPTTKIVSSTLKRAAETAKTISEITKIEIIAYEEGLKERYYGDYRLNNNPDEIPADAEQTEQFQERVINTLLKILLEQHQNLPLVIVSHQKVFEYIGKFLTQKSVRLTQGGIANFTLKNGKWNVDILSNK